MAENILDKIKEELFGTAEDGYSTEDGFLIKLRSGKFDEEQYERIYELFVKINENLVKVDGEGADSICYYTEFINKLVLYLRDTNDPKLMEISADLVGLWGRP